MDPLYEQRLRDEVIFLHSLWHQGPPRPATATAVTSSSATRYNLQPSKPTNFKKKHKRKSRKKLRDNATHDAGSSEGVEWPCPAPPPPTTSWSTDRWPAPEPLPISPEEQLKLAANRVQEHALKDLREFFRSYDSDGGYVIESSDDDELMGGDCGREEYSVIFKVFEDNELREYYEKNFLMGEFSCLVCGAVGGKNSSKKFKGCLSLVQHSIAIGKTKRKGAHRAFAQAVCKVLGWDISRLPEISATLSDKSGNTQGNTNGEKEDNSMAFIHNADNVKDDTSDGKDDEAKPESGAGKSVEEPASDGKDDEANPESQAGKCVEGPASDGLTTSFSTCNDAGKTEIQVHPRGDVSIVPTSTAAASTSTSTSITRYHLQPPKPINFKKKLKRKSQKILPNNATHDSGSSHGVEWPCPATPSPTTAWPTQCGPTLKPLPLSPEKQSKLAAKCAHQNALKVVREFFTSYYSDGFDEIESSDDDEPMDIDCDHEEYSILFKVFEDTNLKEYYEKNFVMGEFSCLVCGALGGKNTGKKFKGCLPLVQHSIAIEKTKRRGAHRVFAQAVCKVLGWDINCLHEIVAMLSDKSGNTQGNGNGDKEDSSTAFIPNPDNVKDDTLDGKDNEAETESDAGKNVEEPASDGKNDETKPEFDAGKNVEEPASDGKNDETKPESDAGKSVEEPASDGLTTGSSVHPDADKVENLGMEHQHNVQQTAIERPKIVENEVQETVQMN